MMLKFIKDIKTKLILNLAKEKIKTFLDKTKVLISNNIILVAYIIGSIINGILLRAFTVGSSFAISPILADLFISILFSSFYFLIKDKRKFLYVFIMSIGSTFICIVNSVYYHYFGSFISVTFISFVMANTETGNANVVGNLLSLKFFSFFWLPIFMIVVQRILKMRKINKKRKYSEKNLFKLILTWSLISFLVFLTTLKPVDYSRFYSQWNREYLVAKFGIYLYQANDLIKSVEPQMASLFGSDKAYKEFSEYYSGVSDTSTSDNKYTGIFEGKNVIAIHAESIQNVLINLKLNGKSVAPNLSKLANEGLYFSNFYSQVSVGTSSDTEFSIATSLLPVNSGTVFVNYYDREYISMYDLLRQKGYYTFSMHANTGDFWNRNIMHENLGYDDFYEKASYNIDETIGFGLSDKSFMLQSVEKIKKIAAENEKYYGTLITLSNHTPFGDTEQYGEFDVTQTVDGINYPYMEGTKLGNYFKSVRYSDEQIGLLIKELEANNLLDDTVIIIYGDHDARISKNDWDRLYNYDYATDTVKDENDEGYIDIDYYWYEQNRRVPFIIWSNDKTFQEKYAKEVKTVMGMIDVAPTLGNMFNFYNKYSLGTDIFEAKDNIVVFPNGNFVTNNVYYNDSKGEYKLLKDTPLEEDYITNNKEIAETKLRISNNIIVYDFLKKDLSTEKYEVEK